MKDVVERRARRAAAILGGHTDFGDARRAWDFSSPRPRPHRLRGARPRAQPDRLRRPALRRVGGRGWTASTAPRRPPHSSAGSISHRPRSSSTPRCRGAGGGGPALGGGEARGGSGSDDRRRRDRLRAPRLRVHGQGARERPTDDPVHVLAVAAARELVAVAGRTEEKVREAATGSATRLRDRLARRRRRRRASTSSTTSVRTRSTPSPSSPRSSTASTSSARSRSASTPRRTRCGRRRRRRA